MNPLVVYTGQRDQLVGDAVAEHVVASIGRRVLTGRGIHTVRYTWPVMSSGNASCVTLTERPLSITSRWMWVSYRP